MNDGDSPVPGPEFERIREALRGRYAVERPVGAGGMASVFLARDLKHDRRVALKVMHRELAASLGPERFLREVGITARLNHPHILPVHDSGESGGLLWYVMPFVEGESLQARIAREGPLPVGDAVRIAREVADALDHAHRHGIVHRDIKPANIMLGDGHALVADFGIARAVRAEGEAITRTGFAVGTPQYMSPEQATGSGDVDGRADIFALAAVLHEMLAGTPPFNGPSVQAILVQVLTGTPTDLAATRDGVPAPLGDLVRRSLASDPALRPPDAGQVRDALQRIEADLVTGSRPTVARAAARRPPGKRAALLALGVAALAVTSGLLFRGRAGSAGPEPGELRLAVLPFTYQGTAEDTLLAEGIVEEVRGKLSRVAGLAVLASTSTNGYRGSDKPPQEIARELRAGYLLVGRVRWAGAGADRKVQVASEIISGESGLTRWAQTFDAAISDVFAVQAALASQVALAIGAALAPEDSRELAERPTASLEAWNLYLKSKSATGWESQLRLLEQAVAVDSGFAEAWAKIVDVTSNTYWNLSRDPALVPRAREALARVRALRPGSALAHQAATFYYDGPERNLDRALAHADSALRLEPGNAELLAGAAGFDIEKGRLDSAVARLQRARQLDPRSVLTLGALQRLLLFTRRLPEAIVVGEELEALAPQNLMSAWRHAMAHAASGDLPAARAAIRAALARGISAPQLAAHFAGYLETGWLLDSTERQLLFRLTPAAFDDDRAWWGQSLAVAHWDFGDRALARAYADSALGPTRAEMEQESEILETRLLHGLLLAQLGRHAEALREVEYVDGRLDQGPGSEAAYELEIMARIYTITGRPDQAIAALRRVLGLSWHITKAWLRLDPAFAALRDEPAFRQLTAE